MKRLHLPVVVVLFLCAALSLTSCTVLYRRVNGKKEYLIPGGLEVDGNVFAKSVRFMNLNGTIDGEIDFVSAQNISQVYQSVSSLKESVQATRNATFTVLRGFSNESLSIAEEAHIARAELETELSRFFSSKKRVAVQRLQYLLKFQRSQCRGFEAIQDLLPFERSLQTAHPQCSSIEFHKNGSMVWDLRGSLGENGKKIGGSGNETILSGEIFWVATGTGGKSLTIMQKVQQAYDQLLLDAIGDEGNVQGVLCPTFSLANEKPSDYLSNTTGWSSLVQKVSYKILANGGDSGEFNVSIGSNFSKNVSGTTFALDWSANISVGDDDELLAYVCGFVNGTSLLMSLERFLNR